MSDFDNFNQNVNHAGQAADNAAQNAQNAAQDLRSSFDQGAQAVNQAAQNLNNATYQAAQDFGASANQTAQNGFSGSTTTHYSSQNDQTGNAFGSYDAGFDYNGAAPEENKANGLQIAGLVLTVIGLVIVVIMAFQKVSLFNMKALFKMITGVVFALCGIILIGVSYGIRWKHRMVNRVSEIEKKWGPARKTNSSLKRAYNINRSSKRRAVRSSQSE